MELVRLDEVLQAQLDRVHAELLGQDVDRPLDHVGRLGDAERAAVGDAARRLVGVDAVDRHMGRRNVVGAGADIEERSEEHTSELQSLMRISYAVFCLKKKKK